MIPFYKNQLTFVGYHALSLGKQIIEYLCYKDNLKLRTNSLYCK